VTRPPNSQRQRILSAAAALFQQQGYPATTIRMIAASVDLGASSLYNHIAGKQELLKEICLLSAERFENGLHDLLRSEASSPGRLKGIIELHVRLAINFPETVTVFNDEWRHLDTDTLPLFLRKRKDYQTAIAELLIEGQKQKSITTFDVEIAVPALLGSMSWIYQRRGLDATQIKPITEQLYTLWESGWQLN